MDSLHHRGTRHHHQASLLPPQPIHLILVLNVAKSFTFRHCLSGTWESTPMKDPISVACVAEATHSQETSMSTSRPFMESLLMVGDHVLNRMCLDLTSVIFVTGSLLLLATCTNISGWVKSKAMRDINIWMKENNKRLPDIFFFRVNEVKKF